MLTRKDIVDEKMLDDLRVIAEFNCKHWDCQSCPFNDFGNRCISADVEVMLEKYEDGEEVIY